MAELRQRRATAPAAENESKNENNGKNAEPFFSAARLSTWALLPAEAVAGTAVATLYHSRMSPSYAPAPETDSERLAFVGRNAYLIGMPLFFTIFGVMRALDDSTKTEDPLGGHESHRFKVTHRIFTNHVEQTILFMPLFTSAALNVSRGNWPIIPTILHLWVAGRFAFTIGYFVPPWTRSNPFKGLGWFTKRTWARSPGFIVTFMSAGAALLANFF
jgi:MAPEG family